MTNTEWLDLFFSRSYENQINDLILNDWDYEIPHDAIRNYIYQLKKIPYSQYIDYLKTNKEERIVLLDEAPSNVEFSLVVDLLNYIINENNCGVEPEEVGEAFEDKFPLSIANKRNGLMLLRQARICGLVYEHFGSWYINCISYVFVNLEPSDQQSYLVRLLTRSPLYRSILSNLTQEDVPLINVCRFDEKIKIKTILRSVSNLLDLCREEAEKDNISLGFIFDNNQLLSNNPTIRDLCHDNKISWGTYILCKKNKIRYLSDLKDYVKYRILDVPGANAKIRLELSNVYFSALYKNDSKYEESSSRKIINDSVQQQEPKDNNKDKTNEISTTRNIKKNSSSQYTRLRPSLSIKSLAFHGISYSTIDVCIKKEICNLRDLSEYIKKNGFEDITYDESEQKRIGACINELDSKIKIVKTEETKKEIQVNNSLKISAISEYDYSTNLPVCRITTPPDIEYDYEDYGFISNIIECIRQNRDPNPCFS